MSIEKINHGDMVAALAKSGEAIRAVLTASDCHLIHMSIGIAGEAGGLISAVKKHTIYRTPLDLENVIEELGDLEFYMEGLRQELNLSRDQILKANIQKLGKRYAGFKYSDLAAKERKDKQ